MATANDFKITSQSESPHTSRDFNKIKIGKTTLSNDVFFDIDYKFDRHRHRPFRRKDIVRALAEQDIKTLRDISQRYFAMNGIYMRLCRYIAYLYRYDWMITPIVYDDNIKPEKIIEGWYKASNLLDNCRLRKNFGEIALKVVKNGCYYGYKVEQREAAYLQELHPDYCRSRYKINGKPIVEFNIKYFDDKFADADYKIRVLKLFPEEFRKAYLSYKRGTLKKDFNGDESGWFVLDPDRTVKFNLSNTDIPLFVAVIPKLLDLEDAQDLDKKRMEQQLLRLVIQEMPLDKNGESIFDIPEIQAFHNNAVEMVGDAIGISVLTTLADVKVEDLSDNGNMSSADQLDKVERTVYNEAGVSQKQFNTDGNIALEKSIANDEATMTDLLLQFEEYAESLLKPFNKNTKRLKYKVTMLPTTIYNYKDLSKTYKEQTQIGFSKLLPQVALGQSQSTVMATAYFENELLHLEELFIPPQMSSTMSGNNNKTEKGDSNAPTSEGGRPELPDDQKSEKTIANRESAS